MAIPPDLQVSIAGSPELQRRQINAIIGKLLGLVGYGSALPDPADAIDGALFVTGGVIYQNQTGAWVSLT